MKYVDLTFPSAAANLACEEALLDLAEAGHEDEVLRFWEPVEPFVVVGYANRVATEVNVPACAADRIGIFRRFSGGGTVLQGAGCLNYALILRIPDAGPLQTITGTNQFILDRQKSALSRALGKPVEAHGHTDLAVGNLKFSGNAQRRRRKFLIFHGTLLLRFDLALVEKYLRMPSQQPGYRQDRSHADFLMNLQLDAETTKQTLRHAWGANEPLTTLPSEAIDKLSRTKYSTAEWNLKF